MPTPTRVHVVFKTHFDFGFTDFAAAVQKQYFDSFIPQVLDQARRLREDGARERYVWTTGSWLIYRYLEKADPAHRRQMEAAIEAGDIAWHALPFTLHSELADASLFQHGLRFLKILDERFGRTTIAAKMTDVPGHTLGIVPVLAEAGVEFLHIGVNEAATPPDVPPLFVWSAGEARITVMYQHAYGADMQVAGLDEALAFGFTEDNVGPQSIEEIRRIYRNLEAVYSGAVVEASTLDRFARAVRDIEASLPVVTQEIGDTWIHGAGTDPRKVSRYRALSRLRQRWLDEPGAGPDPDSMLRFSDHLLCVAEHTWGLDEKTHLADYRNYARPDFERVRPTAPFQKMEASWQEQRAYIDQALEALGDSPARREADRVLKALEPVRPTSEDFDPAPPLYAFTTRHFEAGIDPATGALSRLVDRASGRVWASPDAPLGVIRYQNFSEADYDRFMDEYLASRPEWGILDNSKPGIGAASARSEVWQPEVKWVSIRESATSFEILVELSGPDEAVAQFGCPAEFFIRYSFQEAEPVVEVEVQWFGKPACRLPEALWCSFQPAGTKPKGWRMEKMGRMISPLDVVSRGNRTLHAVDRGVFYEDGAGSLSIESLDAPLVAPGEPALLRFQNRHPDLAGGWHFNLYNNAWGTNFPMWYDEDARFRFRVRGSESGVRSPVIPKK